MKWIGIFVVIILLALVAPSAADIIDPNTGGYHNMYEPKLVERCYRIENANEYPGYVFGVAPYPNQSDGFVSFDDKRCFFSDGAQNSQVYAMQKTDFNQLKRENPEYITYRVAIPSGYPAPLRSGIYFFYRLPKNETVVLSIFTLDESRFVLDTVQEYITFGDGQQENITVNEPVIQKTTAPSSQASTVPTPVVTTSPSSMPSQKSSVDPLFLAFSAISGIVISLILVRKRRE